MPSLYARCAAASVATLAVVLAFVVVSFALYRISRVVLRTRRARSLVAVIWLWVVRHRVLATVNAAIAANVTAYYIVQFLNWIGELMQQAWWATYDVAIRFF